MTDIRVTGLLIILILLLSTVWFYPFIKPDMRSHPQYRICKSGVYLVTGLVLISLITLNPALDLFMILRLIAGFTLLYEGIVTLLNLYTDTQRTKTIG